MGKPASVVELKPGISDLVVPALEVVENEEPTPENEQVSEPVITDGLHAMLEFHKQEIEETQAKTRFSLKQKIIVGCTVVALAGVLYATQMLKPYKGTVYNEAHFVQNPEAYPRIDSYFDFMLVVGFTEKLFMKHVPIEKRTTDISEEDFSEARSLVWQDLRAHYSDQYSSQILDKAMDEAQVNIGMPRNFLDKMK